jgi:hypothetical protein
MSFIKNLFSCVKSISVLQGHLSATLLAIKFLASKHFKPAAAGMFQGHMQMMDSVDENY